MITEDYVSFETAKLLKDKGFDEPTTKSYYTEGLENPMIFSHDLLPCIQTDEFLCPTLQMVMKWLREVHDIFIEISVDEMLKDEGYQWTLYYNSTKEIRPYSGWGNSYEKACEAAVKHCLEKLI